MSTSLNSDIAGFADRVNNLLNEKDAITSDVREVYDEAKEQGVNVKALRKVIAKRRAKTPDPAVVAAMEAYEHALDEAALMVSKGASLRQAEKATGASKSAIQRRQVSRRNENAVSGTAHDPDTGEIKDPVPDAPVGGGGTADTPDGPGTSPKPYCRECEGTGIIVYDDGGKIHGQEPCPICRVEEEPPTDEAGAVGSLQGDRVADHEIDLTIPARLDRRARA
jgi:uncharacterized protein (UPF0335 family)